MLRSIALSATLLFAAGASADDPGDDYGRGYAQGLLDARFKSTPVKVLTVMGGNAILRAQECVQPRQRQALEQALTGLANIARVKWRGPPYTAVQASKRSETPAPIVSDEVALPAGELFPALMADSRQPRFAAHYQAHYIPGGNFNAGLASIGDSFALARTATRAGRFEIGIQAGIFSLFNLDTASLNLINTDFVIGFPASYRRGAFSARGRVYHQSSHLGHEFLLGNPGVERINLSYEDAELLLAYELRGIRIYGGGAIVFRPTRASTPRTGTLDWKPAGQVRSANSIWSAPPTFRASSSRTGKSISPICWDWHGGGTAGASCG